MYNAKAKDVFNNCIKWMAVVSASPIVILSCYKRNKAECTVRDCVMLSEPRFMNFKVCLGSAICVGWPNVKLLPND